MGPLSQSGPAGAPIRAPTRAGYIGAMSMLIRGGTLLHLDPPGVERADLRVRDGIIEELAARE